MTFNRCNIVSSHKCLTYTNQTFCTLTFNRKLITFYFFWGVGGGEYFETERQRLFYFCVDVAQAEHGQFILGSHLKSLSPCPAYFR